MVLRNFENKKYRVKIERKAYKIERKGLVSAGKRYYDLSLNSCLKSGSPVFMRVPVFFALRDIIKFSELIFWPKISDCRIWSKMVEYPYGRVPMTGW